MKLRGIRRRQIRVGRVSFKELGSMNKYAVSHVQTRTPSGSGAEDGNLTLFRGCMCMHDYASPRGLDSSFFGVWSAGGDTRRDQLLRIPGRRTGYTADIITLLQIRHLSNKTI